ncbi:MAG: hypothetical protein L6U99_09600 [Clostridium sp.]|nr:MAG: hypothetical protein L6U99_09600 [Clostridium sp.]
MKKNYQTPVLEEENVEIEDIIAASGIIGGDQPGDKKKSILMVINLIRARNVPLFCCF